MPHTSGPWTVVRDDDGLLYIYMEANAGKDQALAVYAAENPEQRLADANLIAAAPDLLAAADLAIHKIEQTQQGQYPEGQALGAALNALVEAIAKARGES